jgi:predicted Zn-ribbon and HTH transcriptional regulator
VLTQLVNLLENRENGLSLSEISRLMNAQPTAVLSMMQLLVKKGKLLEIGPDNKCCTTCGFESDCSLLAARGKRYVSLSCTPLPAQPESPSFPS